MCKYSNSEDVNYRRIMKRIRAEHASHVEEQEQIEKLGACISGVNEINCCSTLLITGIFTLRTSNLIKATFRGSCLSYSHHTSSHAFKFKVFTLLVTLSKTLIAIEGTGVSRRISLIC